MKKISGLLSVLFISVICLVGCSFGGGDASSKYNININADENIEVKTYVDQNKDYLIVYLTNNNEYNIGSYDVKVIYYDNNGNKIDEDDTTQLDFMNGKDSVVTLALPRDEEYNGYVPDKVELSVKIDQEYQEIVGGGTLYNDKVEVSHKKVGDEIEVTLKNTSGVDLTTVEAVVLFMKDGKPISAEELSGSFKNGESDTGSISIPEDWEASFNSDEDVLINYDDIKIVINRATAE